MGSGVRTNDSGAPPSPKLPAPDAPDIAPRQTAYCTGHPGRGPAGLVWGAPQRSRGRARTVCQSPQRCSGRWLQHLFLSSSTITPAKRPPGRISAAAFARPSVATLQRVQRLPWAFSSPSRRCASGASSPQTVLPNAPGDPRLPPSGLLAGPVPLYVFHCPSHTCLARFSSLSQFLSTLPPSFSHPLPRALPCLLHRVRVAPGLFFFPALALHRRAKSVAAHTRTRTCTHTSFTRQGLDAAQRRLETTQGRTETRRDEAALDGQPTSSSPFHSPQSFAPLRSPSSLSPYWAASPYHSPPC